VAQVLMNARLVHAVTSPPPGQGPHVDFSKFVAVCKDKDHKMLPLLSWR
jgi:hypothetical protein